MSTDNTKSADDHKRVKARQNGNKRENNWANNVIYESGNCRRFGSKRYGYRAAKNNTDGFDRCDAILMHTIHILEKRWIDRMQNHKVILLRYHMYCEGYENQKKIMNNHVSRAGKYAETMKRTTTHSSGQTLDDISLWRRREPVRGWRQIAFSLRTIYDGKLHSNWEYLMPTKRTVNNYEKKKVKNRSAQSRTVRGAWSWWLTWSWP